MTRSSKQLSSSGPCKISELVPNFGCGPATFMNKLIQSPTLQEKKHLLSSPFLHLFPLTWRFFCEPTNGGFVESPLT